MPRRAAPCNGMPWHDMQVKKFVLLIKIDTTNPLNNAFIGHYSAKLCLVDLVNFPFMLARNAGVKIPDIKTQHWVPEACIEDTTLKISAQTLIIAEEEFKAGLQIKGTFHFFGEKFTLDISLHMIVFRALAFSHSKVVKWGPIEMSGYGCDLRANTKDDGVCIDIAVGVMPLEFHFKVSGHNY